MLFPAVNKILFRIAVFAVVLDLSFYLLAACSPSSEPAAVPDPPDGAREASPAWVAEKAEAEGTDSLIAVEITTGSNAVLTMHGKNASGRWKQTLSVPAFIGKNGAGKEREGDLKTPLGTFGFNRAFGLADDPGCALDYVKVDGTHYWDCDGASARYNTLVTTNEYQDFDKEASERIADYPDAYRYVLNTTWNEERIPGKGSAIFLHCQREGRTYTGGCIAIPEEAMEYVMRHVRPETKIVIRLKD